MTVDAARVADLLGLGGRDDAQKVEKLVEALAGLRSRLEMPASIREVGVGEADFKARLDELSMQAYDDQCTGCNPRYPLIREIRQLYLDAWDGDATRA